MKKRKKIQDNDFWYSFLRNIVDINLKLSYRNLKYIGEERIPKDGAVIYSPNHTGTLMDALVILSMNRKPKVFLARADIFKNPVLAKMFRFFKIMPIMRMRDGFEEVKKNNKTIEAAVDVLNDRVPLCIFPEGTHQTKHSLLPLSKGIFRIALQAKELMPDTPLYIVPMGIRYGSFFRFRASARVIVGNPINVGEFIAQNEGKTPQELMNMMKKCLEERMKESIFYIPNNEDYDAVKEICATVSEEQIKRLDKKARKDKAVLTNVNNMAVKHIETLKEKDPEAAGKLIALANEALKRRKEKGISLKSVAQQSSLLQTILKLLMLLVTLPYTLIASVFVLPVTVLCNTICKKFKDKAFYNSVRYLMNLLIWPLLMIIYTVVAFVCLPGIWASVAVLAILPAPVIAHEVYRYARLIVSDFGLHFSKTLRARYREIGKIFFNR
jgi:1-acyl-sn-glycerol-3-phosphate acyltransferase